MELLNASRSGKGRRQERQTVMSELTGWAGVSFLGGDCTCCEIQCSWRSFLQWGGQDRLFANLHGRGRQDSNSLQEWRSPAIRLSCKSHPENLVSDTQQRPQTWGDPGSKLVICSDFIYFSGKWFLVFTLQSWTIAPSAASGEVGNSGPSPAPQEQLPHGRDVSS